MKQTLNATVPDAISKNTGKVCKQPSSSRSKVITRGFHHYTNLHQFLFSRFYCASSCASAVLPVVILSVCLSVRLSHACIVPKPNNICGYSDTPRKGNHPSFLIPTMVGGWRPFHLKFALKVSHPLRKMPTSTDYNYNYANNVWTIRDSEKSSIMTNRKSIMGFPMSYRWSAYVTHKSLKGCLKKRFFVFFK